eukprot:2962191-Rhodomonas_salina.2
MLSEPSAHGTVRNTAAKTLVIVLARSEGVVAGQVRYAIGLHCEIKHKKTQSQYNLYQECVFLHLISGCTRSYAKFGTDMAYGPTSYDPSSK